MITISDYYIYYVQNVVIGLSILGLIFFNLRKSVPAGWNSNRVFLMIVFANAALLLLELPLVLLRGHESLAARIGMNATAALFYMLNPIPAALWVLYLCEHLYPDRHIPKSLLRFVGLPVALNALFALVSVATPFTFRIDAQNLYHRGPFYGFMVLLCCSYIVYYLSIVVSKRRELSKKDFSSLLGAILPPILASVLQNLFFGVSLVWLATAFSLLILYTQILSVQINTDHLTGLANRRKFDEQLETALLGSSRGMGGILIDVDKFKQVNDNYGHDLGDRVLQAVGGILRQSVRRDDLIARFGGDEFAVLVYADELSQLEDTVRRIEENLHRFNERSDFPFSISLSIGYDVYDGKSGLEAQDFFKRIDKKMYEAKFKGTPYRNRH